MRRDGVWRGNPRFKELKDCLRKCKIRTHEHTLSRIHVWMKLHGRGQKQHHKVLSSDPQHPQGYRLDSLLSGPTPLKATTEAEG